MERVLTTPLVDTLAATGDRWNLCSNPSFESGKYDGWFWQGTWMQGSNVIQDTGGDETLTVFGDHSLELKLDSANEGESMYATYIGDDFNDQEWLPVLEDAPKMTFSVYVKPMIVDGDTAQDFSFRLSTGFHNSPASSAQASQVKSVPFGEWSRVSVTVDVPSSGEFGSYLFASFKFDQPFPAGVGTMRVLVDGALIEPSDTALPYFDGSFDGAEWLSGVNLSVSKAVAPFTPELQVTADPANHRAVILAIAKQGYKVKLVREVGGMFPTIVRGLDSTPLETDQELFFDYEVPQGDVLTYLAVFTSPSGEEFRAPPVNIQPQDYGSDLIFPLNDPINGLKIHIEQISNLNWQVSQNVLKVWNRPDPIVVSGAREYPSGSVKFVTFTDKERRELLRIMTDGGVIGLNPRKSDTGFDGIAYFSLGQVTENRMVPRASDPMRRWEAQIQQVSAPPASWNYPVSAGETWRKLRDSGDDWSLVTDELWVDVLDVGTEELI